MVRGLLLQNDVNSPPTAIIPQTNLACCKLSSTAAVFSSADPYRIHFWFKTAAAEGVKRNKQHHEVMHDDVRSVGDVFGYGLGCACAGGH